MRIDRRSMTGVRVRWIGMACAVLVLVAAPGSAQFSTDLSLSVSPDPALSTEPLIVTVTGDASCPRLAGQTAVDGVVEILYSGHCPILPPGPAEFTLYALVGPLTPGLWEFRLIDLDIPVSPPAVIETVLVTVKDGRFSVDLLPSPATTQDEVVARISGVGSCIFPSPPEIEPGHITLRIFDGGICDPPPPEAPFELDHPIGRLAEGDYAVELFYSDLRVAETSLEVAPATACAAGPTALCLNRGRFRVEATWTTPAEETGSGQGVVETDDTGLFWFFEPDNIELVVKVLDGCTTEIGTYWVFAGGLTDVGVQLTVTDTETGDMVTYENPVGQRFTTITDTAAFDTCP